MNLFVVVFLLPLLLSSAQASGTSPLSYAETVLDKMKLHRSYLRYSTVAKKNPTPEGATAVQIMLSEMSSALRFFLGDVPEEDVGFCTPEETGPDALTQFFRGKPVPQSCITIDGTERCYYTYVPKSCQNSESEVPLVVDIHGRNQCPLRSVLYTGWVQKAEEECFVLVMPVSTGGADGTFPDACFNAPGFMASPDFGAPDGNNVITTPCCCEDESGTLSSFDEPDDPKFVSLVIEDALETFSENNKNKNANNANNLATALTIDPARVYVAGHSNGCVLALSMAQLYSDTIAAVSCHAGALVTPPSPEYTPVPIMMIHGREDSTIQYDGNHETVPGVGDFGIWSIPQTTAQLLRQNNCSDSRTYSLEGGGHGVVVEGTSCDAPVKIVTLPNAGHLPYKLPFLPVPEFFGGSVTTEDTTGLAWDFCSAQTKAP